MTKIDFAPATDADIRELSANLLDADLNELNAMCVPPYQGLCQSLQHSIEHVVVRKEGRLGCVAGIVQPTPLSDEVHPWMISTDLILSHPKEVLKYSRLIYLRWQDMFPVMTNFVHAEHKRALHWLKWLGAEFEYIPDYGPLKQPFYKFTMRSKQCVSLV